MPIKAENRRLPSVTLFDREILEEFAVRSGLNTGKEPTDGQKAARGKQTLNLGRTPVSYTHLTLPTKRIV